MKKRILSILLVLVMICLVGCAGTEESYISPTALWCSSFRTLMQRSGTYAADVESLQRASQAAQESIAEIEDLKNEAKVFLEKSLQIADFLAAQEVASFFELSEMQQIALLDAWYILGNANCADSESEYVKIIEQHASAWVDAWVDGSSGYILPLE